MSQSHRLAWAAGFIDGDGFITIQNRNNKVNGKHYRGFYLRVGVNQVQRKPLEELQRLFGGTIRERNSGSSDGFKRKQQYQWCVSTETAAECLRKIKPYVIHKADVVGMALEFQETMGNPSDENKTLRALLQEQIRVRNSED